jgi:methionine-rich copper-binding protein CopC
MRIRLVVPLAACALGLFGATAFGRSTLDTESTGPGVHAELHLALDRSAPEADQVVTGVERVSLWFTQAPQMSGTSIRVVPAGGEPLELGKARMSEEDEKLILLDLSEPLVDGAYEIHWRAMAQDGHTVRGDFGFQVKAAR